MIVQDIPFPSPELAEKIGVVGWSLMVLILSSVASIGFFLNRMVKAIDRMAAAQETSPILLAEIKTILSEKLEEIKEDVLDTKKLAQEHVDIARIWLKTEAPGRSIKKES